MIRANDSQLAQFFPSTLGAGKDLPATAAYLAHHQAMERAGRSYMWGIAAADRRLAGLVFINNIDPDTAMAETSGVLDIGHQSRGLMQRSMVEAFRWAHDQLGLMRIRFLISAENARAIAMAEALGFRPEPRPPRPFAEGTPREALLNYFVLRLE